MPGFRRVKGFSGKTKKVLPEHSFQAVLSQLDTAKGFTREPRKYSPHLPTEKPIQLQPESKNLLLNAFRPRFGNSSIFSLQSHIDRHEI